jgi:hypothetical protein
MFIFLFIGNRKNEKATGMSKWLWITMAIYIPVFCFMIISDWVHTEGHFFTWLPVPTAWMVYGIWFIPLIITLSYMFKFEECIISPEEEKAFHEFLKSHQK